MEKSFFCVYIFLFYTESQYQYSSLRLSNYIGVEQRINLLLSGKISLKLVSNFAFRIR